MKTPEEETMEKTLDELSAKEKDLKQRIERSRLNIIALTDEEAEVKKKMQDAFKAKHLKSFADVNFRHALVGFQVKHAVKFGDFATYYLSPPNGLVENEVIRFINAPVIPETKQDIGPVMAREETLLKYLFSAQVSLDPSKPQPERVVNNLPPHVRLDCIRRLPITTVDKLADECVAMEVLMNITLGQELGN
jgi:hypothetical protein